MDVDDAIPVAGQRCWAELLHVTGKDDKVNAISAKSGSDGLIPRGSVWVGYRTNVFRVDAVPARALQCAGRGVIADDDINGCLEPTGLDGVYQRLKVRPASGCENPDVGFVFLSMHDTTHMQERPAHLGQLYLCFSRAASRIMGWGAISPFCLPRWCSARPALPGPTEHLAIACA